ncbi:MAG: thioredoxin family protein [Candidatus Micrarchaeota archaeon]|nr:thioredoxin family protein [Candidatus Micrarchaeota archaeon]
MGLLSDKDIAYIKDRFKGLDEQVNLALFVDQDGSEYIEKTVQLLKELAAASGKLTLEVADITKEKERAKKLGIARSPGLLITTKSNEAHVCYFGIPAGYQFAALIDDIIDLSSGRTRLSPITIAKLQQIAKPVEITVFVSPSEELCAGAVRIAHQFAMENKNIWASMVDAEQFTELAIHNTVTRVPKVVINGIISFDEPLPENEFLEYVMSAAK